MIKTILFVLGFITLVYITLLTHSLSSAYNATDNQVRANFKVIPQFSYEDASRVASQLR